jgi:TolB protein
VTRVAAASLGVAAALALAGCGGSGPGRRDLVFVSTKSGVYDLYSMDADGSHQRRLTHGPRPSASSPEGLFYAVDPAFSPDGRTIAFASSRDGSLDLFAIDADGSHLRRLTSGPAEDSHPTWSPDGRWIAFVRGSHLDVMGADGRGVRQLTKGAETDADPAWSPRGGWIAYVVHPQGLPSRELWLVRPDGSGAHALTRLEASSDSPAWSPDGRRLAFSTDARGGVFAIDVIGVDGKGLRVVSSSSVDAITPAFSPDGRTIAFSRGGAIVTVRAAGGGERVLTSAADNDSSPVWNPRPRGAK